MVLAYQLPEPFTGAQPPPARLLWGIAVRYPACLADRRKTRRGTLVQFLVARRNEHVHMADVELLVEMRELASCVLEKEAPANGKRDAKRIHEQHGGKDEDGGAVGVEKHGLVASQELQSDRATKIRNQAR